MDARRFLEGIANRVDALREETQNLIEEPNPRLHLTSLEKKLGQLVRDLDENVDDAIRLLTTETPKPKTANTKDD